MTKLSIVIDKATIVIDRKTILSLVIDSFYTFFPKTKTKKINVIIHFFFHSKSNEWFDPYDMNKLLLVGSYLINFSYNK